MKSISLLVLFSEMYHVNAGLLVTLKKDRHFTLYNFCSLKNSWHVANELVSPPLITGIVYSPIQNRRIVTQF